MNLIEKNKQLNELLKKNPKFRLIVPVWSSHRAHEFGSRISFIYYRTADSDGIINLNHIDAAGIDKLPSLESVTDADTLVYGIRYMQDYKLLGLDYEWVYFEQYGTPFLFNEFAESVYRGYRTDFKELNDCVPLLKWYERLKEMPDITERRDSDKPYTSAIINLGRIEGAGVQVVEGRFIDRFRFNPAYIKRGKVFTKYNPYTVTGRPSNRHLNVNWSALPKDDRTREIFRSRYEPQSGSLIGFDWESYHLRLIGRMVGYEFPTEQTAHGHLAEYYGGVDYDTAKATTFRYLYGGLDEAAAKIPFFVKVAEYISEEYRRFVVRGYIQTPIFKRRIQHNRIEEPTEQKVFNYLLQALETEINYRKIAELLNLMEGKMSKIILYTYDALLIDTHPIEREWVLTTFREVMERGGFPVRAYEGNNYNDLEVIP
jgi:hypothetical protein